MESVRIRVEGRVQGVCFRMGARDEAERLGVAGFVRNEADGSVCAEVEGDPPRVAAFVQWCHEGSPWARVTSVDVEPVESRGYRTFEVRR